MNNTIDNTELNRAKRSIRKLIGEIAQLSKQHVEPDTFFAKFLDHTVRALSANGGAIWVIDESNVLQLSHQIKLHAAIGYLDDTAEQQHHRLLLSAVNSQQPHAIAPNSSSTSENRNVSEGLPTVDIGNPTDQLLLLQPIIIEDTCRGVVEIFHDADTKETTRDGYQQFLSRTAELAADFFRNRKLQSLSEQESRWQQLESFSNAVHASLDPDTVAYTIVNDARPILGCDRLSLALFDGRKFRIEAISGQETVNHRSNAVRELTDVVESHFESTESPKCATGSASADCTTEQRDSKHWQSQWRTDGDNSQIVPLAQSSSLIGAIVIENFSNANEPSSPQLTATIARQCETALANAQHHNRIFLRPLWQWLGNRTNQRRFPIRTLTAAILITAITYILLAVQADFKVEASGVLLPETRRDIFAEETGVIRKVLVKHGQRVKTGDTLIKMENIDLAVRRQQTKARLLQTIDDLEIKQAQRDTHSLSETEMIQLGGEIVGLSNLSDSLQREITLLERRLEKLTVRSPIDGIVTTWNPRENLLARPVNNGNRLLSIADDSRDWVLEVKLPEDRSGHVLTAEQTGETLASEYILATEPETRFHGQVKTIATRAETTDQDGNHVMLIVKLDKSEQPPLRPGAEVRTQITCGQRCLGYVWFHELIDFAYSRILF